MSTFNPELSAHLSSALTTIARAWAVARSDGTVMGFTDHDLDLNFEGIVFRAGTGLSAGALQQATGLSVDNTEALGALSDAAISETDILSGRYDGAEVRVWLVNWADVQARQMVFRGSLGDITRLDGTFRAELRGLTDLLNRPVGRIYQKPCSAVLGDQRCGADLDVPGYSHEGVVISAEANRIFDLGEVLGFEPGWFQRGTLTVQIGAASGLSAGIKRDTFDGGRRMIELWEPLRAGVATGDTVRVVAGCDKRFETCRLKFNNAVNFQGFPDLPDEDWVMVHPTAARSVSGESRR